MEMNEENISLLNSIANKYGYRIYGDTFSVNCVMDINSEVNKGKDYFYEAEAYASYDNSDIPNIERFAVCFAGFGTLSSEKETEYYNSLVNAKHMCDELNKAVLSSKN